MLMWNRLIGIIDWFIPSAAKVELCALMGGGISATSELGHGSCFSIRVLTWMSEPQSAHDDFSGTVPQLANAV
jgi:hypothetical protein